MRKHEKVKITQRIGFQYIHVSRVYLALELVDKAKFHLTKAEEILKVACGENHSWMQECQKRKMELQLSRVALK